MTLRTVRLRVVCPKCGAPPAVQVYQVEVGRYEQDPPEQPVLTVKCQRRSCGCIYDVKAKAFQQAS